MTPIMTSQPDRERDRQTETDGQAGRQTDRQTQNIKVLC